MQETGGAGIIALEVNLPEFPLSAIGVMQLATVEVWAPLQSCSLCLTGNRYLSGRPW